MLLYNPLNGSIRCVDTKIADLLAVFPYPDSLLLYTITNRLYIFDQDFEHFKEINLGDLKENIAKRFFQHFITVGRKIFAIPCQLDNIYVVETESWNIRRLDFPDDFYMYPDVRVKFWGFQLVNNDLYLFPQGSDEILRINTQTEKIEGKTFPVPFSNYEIEPYKEIYRVRKERLKKELQLKEGLFLRLHDFIDLIS